MERIGKIRLLFFDKTGTLTTGVLSVLRAEPTDDSVDERELLACLASLESGSEHAIAQALLAAAKQRHIELGTVRSLDVAPGRGLHGEVSRGATTRDVFAGTAEYLTSAGIHGVPPESPDGPCSDMTRVLVAWEEQVRGGVFLSDSPRVNVRETVDQLRHAGIETILLSGDRAGPVQRTAGEGGIANYYASCLPDGKLGHIRTAQKNGSGSVIGMAGDGINDAPALAAADVGIAVGAGTELARQSGNVVLLGNRLLDIPWLIALSRSARRIVRQNLFWALGYNAIAISAAVAGVLHPLLAALAMVISSLTLISNSTRLSRFPGRRNTLSEVQDGEQT
jgi:cation transport ATPase